MTEALPALTFARKRLKRESHPAPGSRRPRWSASRAPARSSRLTRTTDRRSCTTAVGELLLAVVALAGELRVDPEIALRRAVAA